MALVDVKQKVIHCKIVYYGPGMSGKSSNLDVVYARIPPADRGELLAIPTETERTLFFDCQVSGEALLRGFRLRWHLYTVPGSVLYEHTKTAVLKGADGIVFVADSRHHKIDENRMSLRELAGFLQAKDKTLRAVPIVLQYNKRDLPDILTVEALNQYLNPFEWQHFEAVASSGWHTPADAHAGEGVIETFQEIRTLVIDSVKASKEEVNAPTILRWGDVAEKLSYPPYSDVIHRDVPWRYQVARPKRTALQWLNLVVFTLLATIALIGYVFLNTGGF